MGQRQQEGQVFCFICYGVHNNNNELQYNYKTRPRGCTFPSGISRIAFVDICLVKIYRIWKLGIIIYNKLVSVRQNTHCTYLLFSYVRLLLTDSLISWRTLAHTCRSSGTDRTAITCPKALYILGCFFPRHTSHSYRLANGYLLVKNKMKQIYIRMITYLLLTHIFKRRVSQ